MFIGSVFCQFNQMKAMLIINNKNYNKTIKAKKTLFLSMSLLGLLTASGGGFG